MKISRKKIILS